MYVLDSDILSLFGQRKEQQPYLVQRIRSTLPEHLCLTIITVEEAYGGALKLINSPNQKHRQLENCELLRRILRSLSEFRILPYDAQANGIYTAMPAATKRIGKNDCKITSIAKAQGYTVITRNTEHFRQIGVACVDWTREEE